jgi:hypothetical protein
VLACGDPVFGTSDEKAEATPLRPLVLKIESIQIASSQANEPAVVGVDAFGGLGNQRCPAFNRK